VTKRPQTIEHIAQEEKHKSVLSKFQKSSKVAEILRQKEPDNPVQKDNNVELHGECDASFLRRLNVSITGDL
jgi:hypothetical protein